MLSPITFEELDLIASAWAEVQRIREERRQGIVDIDMLPDLISCLTCDHPLTALGELRASVGKKYVWWECEQCDSVWYIKQGVTRVTRLTEWKDHPREQQED